VIVEAGEHPVVTFCELEASLPEAVAHVEIYAPLRSFSVRGIGLLQFKDISVAVNSTSDPRLPAL